MSIWKKILNAVSPVNAEIEREKLINEIKGVKVETTPKKSRKPKATKTPKEIATEKGEPYINVLSVDLDKKNLGNGSFELDWNDAFIKELRAAGYPGKTDEDVVDMWFRAICRNVLAEAYEQDEAQKSTPDNVRYINRKLNDDGKTEVS